MSACYSIKLLKAALTRPGSFSAPWLQQLQRGFHRLAAVSVKLCTYGHLSWHAQVFQLLLTVLVAQRQPPSLKSLAIMMPPSVAGGHRQVFLLFFF
jgi:hypothetical protein